jgi:hypothetical protein
VAFHDNFIKLVRRPALPERCRLLARLEEE